MLKRKILQFPHKAILTAAMLEEIYSYPREAFRLKYRDYADGILEGMDYRLDDNGDLILTAGLFKFDGEIFVLSDDVNISELSEQSDLEVDQTYFVSPMKTASLRREVCLTEEQLELQFIDQNSGNTLGQFEYRGRSGFKLPNSVDDFFFNGNFIDSNFVNVIDVPMAARDSATLHPLIFRAVEKFLASKENKTFMDCALLIAIQNSGVVNQATIETYIAEEGGVISANRTELLREFFRCLKESEPKAIYSVQSKEEAKTAHFKRTIGKMI